MALFRPGYCSFLQNKNGPGEQNVCKPNAPTRKIAIAANTRVKNMTRTAHFALLTFTAYKSRDEVDWENNQKSYNNLRVITGSETCRPRVRRRFSRSQPFCFEFFFMPTLREKFRGPMTFFFFFFFNGNVMLFPVFSSIGPYKAANSPNNR